MESVLANGSVHSSVTGFLVRVDVVEMGGMSVTWTDVGACELSGARKGSRRPLSGELRGSVQSVRFVSLPSLGYLV